MAGDVAIDNDSEMLVAVQAECLSVHSTGCALNLPHKVKLRRNRLVNVETVPNQLKDIVARNQTSSLFLKLPWDVRLKIYQLALGGQHLRIKWRCPRHKYQQQYIAGRLYCEVIDDGDGKITTEQTCSRDPYTQPRVVPGGIPPLPRTCRQIYLDTALMYYSLNKFSFDHEWIMKKWMKSLAPVQKRAIAHLALPRRSDVPKYILKDLRGLRKVDIPARDIIFKDWERFTEWSTALWNSRGVSVIWTL